MGFQGKLCIHPDQITTVNAGFGASEEQLAWARTVLEAYEAAGRRGSRLASVGGQMIDEPVVARARALIGANAPRSCA